MKKIGHLLLLIVFLFVISACGGKPTDFKLNREELNLNVGESFQLEPETDIEGKIDWTSTVPEVASVDAAGTVLALKAGETEIIAAWEGLQASCVVNVFENDEELDYTFTSDFSEMPSELEFEGNGTAKVNEGVLELEATEAYQAKLNFASYLSGTIVLQARIKIADSGKINLFTLESEKTVLEMVAEEGVVKYHDGSDYVPAFNYETDVYYDFRLILYLVDVTSETDKGYFDLYVNDTFIKSCVFKEGGIGVEDKINAFAFGPLANGGHVFYDEISVFEGERPEIVLKENETQLLLDESPVYEFKYTVLGNPSPSVNIVCENKETGYSFEDGSVIFYQPGIYRFRIQASSLTGFTSKSVNVTVAGEHLPGILTIEEDYAIVFLNQNPTYELKYHVDGGYPTPEVSITCDSERGYTLNNNTVSFMNAGLYNFTIKCTNDAGASEASVTVLVKANEMIYSEDFSSATKPNNLSVISKGVGKVNFDGETMNIIAEGAANSTFVEIPFGERLTGKVIAETRFMVTTYAFSNALFFYNNDASDNIVACLAFQNGSVLYHDGSWRTATSYQLNTWYDIKMVLNIEEAMFDLYLDDEYIGTYGFRVPAKRDTITKFFIGSDKTNTDMYYDYLRVYYETPAEK